MNSIVASEAIALLSKQLMTVSPGANVVITQGQQKYWLLDIAVYPTDWDDKEPFRFETDESFLSEEQARTVIVNSFTRWLANGGPFLPPVSGCRRLSAPSGSTSPARWSPICSHLPASTSTGSPSCARAMASTP